LKNYNNFIVIIISEGYKVMNNMKKIGVDISHWLWFTLILSLIPLLFSLWRVYSNSQNVDLLANIDQVICHGELLL